LVCILYPVAFVTAVCNKRIIIIIIIYCHMLCGNDVYSATTTAVIQGLRPYTFFRFAVRSHAGDVAGPFGDEIRCRTAEGRKY